MPIRRRRRPVDLPGRPAPESAGRPASLGSGATSIELIAEEEEELPPAPREPELLEVVARFSTASAALSFAEQVTDGIALDSLPIARRADDHAWWIRSTLTLDSAREIAGLCAGELYLPRGDELVRDLGWGDSAGSGPSLALIDLAPVSLLELVRTAGLHPAPARPLWEIVVLMPGHLVTGLVRRALDIGLTATYQRVRLVPLFRS